MDRYKFICSDETVNNRGFVVKTDGIDLSVFLKNPVMLWSHLRPNSGGKPEILPIGKWENVRKEGGQLTAEAVFDEKDEFAVKVAEKVKNGFLSACSIGIHVIEIDENPENWIKGQTMPTITRCQLFEISICDIPSNGNALSVALYDENNQILQLSDVPGFSIVAKTSDKAQYRALAETLGLDEDTDPETILNAVKGLKAIKEKSEADKRQVFLTSIEKAIETAIEERRICAPEKELYRQIGLKAGLNLLNDLLQTKPKAVTYASTIRPITGDGFDTKNYPTDKPKSEWTLNDYRRFAPEELERNPYLLQSLLEVYHKS